MVKLNDGYDSMNERQRAIYIILETKVLAINAALATGNEQTIPNHLNIIKEFIGEAKKYGVDPVVTEKYKLVLQEWGAE